MTPSEPIIVRLTDTVRVSPDQVSCDLSGGKAILNLKTGTYYGLDAVGARIWELAKAPRAVSAILDVIVAEYDVVAHQCERDLLLFLENLVAEGLLETGSTPA